MEAFRPNIAPWRDNGPGQQVTLQTCTDAANQKWRMARRGGVFESGAGNCMSTLAETSDTTNVWARKLSGGRYALVFLNTGSSIATITCDSACIAQTGLSGKSVTVRDLWSHKDLAPIKDLTTLTAADLPAAGGHSFLLLAPA